MRQFRLKYYIMIINEYYVNNIYFKRHKTRIVFTNIEFRIQNSEFRNPKPPARRSVSLRRFKNKAPALSIK